jgi:hypothetical protein
MGQHWIQLVLQPPPHEAHVGIRRLSVAVQAEFESAKFEIRKSHSKFQGLINQALNSSCRVQLNSTCTAPHHGERAQGARELAHAVIEARAHDVAAQAEFESKAKFETGLSHFIGFKG